MSEFDPAQPSLVHEGLNGDTFQWQPEKWSQDYRRRAIDWGSGIINWDGLLLDGWRPIAKRSVRGASR